MAHQYRSHLERLGVPAWARGALVGVFAAILFGNLGLITYSWWSDPAPGRIVLLGVLWALGLVGCVILLRLWSAVTHRPLWPSRPSKAAED